MCKLNASTAATTNAQCFTVPTKDPAMTRTEEQAQKKVIDTRYLKEEDLKTLKEQDPFLYYSIPGVRAATILSNGSVDMSSLRCGVSPRRASCPSRIESTPFKVERRTCISFECHTDLLLEDCFDEMAELSLEGGDDADVDFDDAMFHKLLRRGSNEEV